MRWRLTYLGAYLCSDSAVALVPNDVIPNEVTELLFLLLKLRHSDVGEVLTNKELHECAVRFAGVVHPIPPKVRRGTCGVAVWLCASVEWIG